MIRKVNLLFAIKLAEKNGSGIEVAKPELQDTELKSFITVYPDGTFTETVMNYSEIESTTRKSIYELDLRSQDWVLI
ncbi:hypothetical protein [Proteus phage RP7]|nr:hypothetical protein [Proteus phage RP7]